MRITEINDSSRIQSQVRKFVAWMKKRMDIKGNPEIRLVSNRKIPQEKRTFGTTYSDGKIWVYTGNRNLADILRTVCHEMVHFHQYNLGTAHNDMTEEETFKIEDEANAMAGRLMREYGKINVEIYEGRTGSLQPDVAAALPATYSIPELKNQDPYLQYRFSVSMAGAKGRAQREQDGVPPFNTESAWGENEIVVSFDPDIEKYIDDALQQMGIRGKKLISTRKSEEAKSVGKTSPINAFKGYPR